MQILRQLLLLRNWFFYYWPVILLLLGLGLKRTCGKFINNISNSPSFNGQEHYIIIFFSIFSPPGLHLLYDLLYDLSTNTKTKDLYDRDFIFWLFLLSFLDVVALKSYMVWNQWSFNLILQKLQWCVGSRIFEDL